MAAQTVPYSGAIVTKCCVTCGQQKLLSEFGRSSAWVDGLRRTCKVCRRGQARSSYWKNPVKAREASAKKRRRLYALDPAGNAARAKAYRAKRRIPKASLTPEEIATKATDRLRRKREARKRTYQKNKKKVLATAASYRVAHKSEEQANRAAHYQRNKAHVAAVAASYRRANPDIYAEAFARRRASKRRAIPQWSERNAVKEIYAEAARLSRETGIPHEVDHVVPLQSAWVCGLHWEGNLKIIPMVENRSKANSRWPDMGAIVELPHPRRCASRATVPGLE